MAALYERNGLDNDQVISVVVTGTADITSFHPVTAAREFGLDDVPLLGAQELEIAGTLPRCVRILLHVETDRAPQRAAARLPGGRHRPAPRPEGLTWTGALQPATRRGRANVVGLGLIGGSVALALSARGWTVTGEDAEPGRVEAALRMGAIAAGGLDPDASLTVRRHPGLGGARSGQAGIGLDQRGRHGRRQREGAGGSRGHRRALLWRPPDGGLGARRSRRRRCHHVRGRGLGPHTDRGHVRHHVRRRRPGGVGPGGRGGRAAAGAPRRAGGGGEPRAPPGRGRADDHGRRAGRGARRPAAPGRRRLPGHDPDRRRTAGALDRHLRREPPGHRRRPGRPRRSPGPAAPGGGR